jgi:XTP/dITP diphosphohydrolase
MKPLQRIILASGNRGKIREFSDILNPLGISLVSQGELGIAACAETGLSFVENAIQKARHAAERSGLPALADDSGIEVDALLGRPGIYSARYAGEDASDVQNNDLLLSELADLPMAQRSARYRCVIVLMLHAEDPFPVIAHGTWEGMVTMAPAGSGGFGYDPLFFLPERGCTAAELTSSEKNALGHRGQALRSLAAEIGLLQRAS